MPEAKHKEDTLLYILQWDAGQNIWKTKPLAPDSGVRKGPYLSHLATEILDSVAVRRRRLPVLNRGGGSHVN